MRRQAVSQVVEVIRRRIDEQGTREPVIQRQGEDRVLVQAPGVDDPQELIDLIGTTARLTFHMVDTSVSVQEALDGRIPPGSRIVDSIDGYSSNYVIRRDARVTGDNLTNAQPIFNQDGLPAVSITMDGAGTRAWSQITTQNVGRLFAIVLDDEVISAPRIREPILSPTSQISGNFTTEEANQLAILLRAGALPAPLTIIEQRNVGPGLGQDSIDAGRIALIIGGVGVVVFMIAAYGLFGVFANVALIANVALLMGLLSAIQATLTLPGIAGIILTVGMAVDANVLIFERVREEVRQGRSPVSALEAGYRGALTTILDANITTLIAAVILLWLGSGPVRGFAVTLGLGIVTSVFTAFVFSRLMISVWMSANRPKQLPI